MQQRTTPKKASSLLPENLAKSMVHKVYNLGEIITEDVTGTIYAAKSRLKGEPVAVNVLAQGCKIASTSLIKIEHPNICKAHKVLKLNDGTIAIVIEKPKGKPILKFIDDSTPKKQCVPGQSVSAILQLLSALHAIHATGKTAQNLSVNNVFLYKDQNNNLKLKLVSLGIGGTGVNLKAPHYLSPERIMNVDKGDPRADIWAAGAVFYHLCFGKPPFAGNDAVEVAKKNMLEEPDFDKKGREIPDELVAIIKRAIHRDENKRYPTAGEMVGELLPLREIYKEPMSEEVKSALKHSYPPPSPKEKLAPKKPTREDITGLNAIHRATKKSERKDPTAEYGTKKKRKIETETLPRRVFSAEVEKKKPGISPKKPIVGPRKGDPNRTLLGMPAVSAAAIQEAEAKKAAATSPEPTLEKDTRQKKNSEEESLFSPRSILGSEEDIKKLEEEMDFLEERDDGDVPTLVTSEQNIAAIVGRLKEIENEKSKREAAVSSTPARHRTKKETDLIAQPAAGDIPETPVDAPLEATPRARPNLNADQAPEENQYEPPTETLDEFSAFDIIDQADQAALHPLKTASVPGLETEPAAVETPADTMDQVTAQSLKTASLPMEPSEVETPIEKNFLSRLHRTVKEQKKLFTISGIAAASVLFVIVVLLIAFSDDAPQVTDEKTTAAVTAPKPKEKTAVTITEVEVQPAELAKPEQLQEPAAAAADDNSAAAETAEEEPETVSIRFLNLPDKYTAKIDGKPTALPIEMDKTKTISTVVILAEGYEPFKIRIVPDRDREIPARMTKSPGKKKKKKKKKKSSGGKSKKDGDALVSNPFKK